MAVTIQQDGKTVKTIGQGSDAAPPSPDEGTPEPTATGSTQTRFFSIKVTREGMKGLKVTAAVLGVKLKVMASDALVRFLADPPAEVDKYTAPHAEDQERFSFHVSGELGDAVIALAKSYVQKPSVSYQDIIVMALNRVLAKHTQT